MVSKEHEILYIGHLRATPDWQYLQQIHPHHELIVVLNGKMHLLIHQQSIIGNQGDILFYPEKVYHDEWADPQLGVEVGYIGFKKPLSKDLKTKIQDYRGRLRILIQWLLEEKERNWDPSSPLLIALFSTFLQEWFSLQTDPTPHLIVEKCRRYMNENLSRPISLEELAHHVSLSKFHFLRIYRQLTGLTPIKEFQKIRLLHAQQLILTTPLPLKEIAIRVGFSGVSPFNRAFKRQFGYLPSYLRNLSYQ